MSLTKGTPASSQIIWLEGRVKELEAERDVWKRQWEAETAHSRQQAEQINALKTELAACQKKAGGVARAFNGLHEQLEACKEDAERYRWLRHKYTNGEMTYFASNCSGNEAEIDEAIDQARKEGA